MEFHRGPRIDKIPVAGVPGLIFAVGMVIGILIAVPTARLWIYISVPIGIVFGLCLRYMHRGQM